MYALLPRFSWYSCTYTLLQTHRYVDEDAWNAQHIEMLVRAGVLVRSKVAGKRRVKMLDFLD